MRLGEQRAVEKPVEMTSGSFEEQWPPLAARLGKRMARSCPDACEREDLVQEVGLRLFRMWDRIDDRPLWPLVLTIALNLRRDAHRAWHEPVMPLTQDPPATFDVEREGLARVELRRVHEALQLLSAAHREVLLAEIGNLPPANMTAGAMKMTRMRARRRLNQLLEGSGGTFILVPTAFKERLVGWRNALVTRAASLGQADLVPYAAGVMAAAITLAAPAAPSMDRSIEGGFELAGTIPSGTTAESGDVANKSRLLAASGQSFSPQRTEPARGSSAGDESTRGDGYAVELPGGEAEVAAEGMFAGSRFALGPVAPAVCLGSPGSGSCGTHDGPLIKMRVGVKYGEYRIEREISVDPGTEL